MKSLKLTHNFVCEHDIPSGATHYLITFGGVNFYKNKPINGCDHWFYFSTLSPKNDWPFVSHYKPNGITKLPASLTVEIDQTDVSAYFQDEDYL